MLSFCDYLGIVVKCFQSERSSRQSLQFLRPTHQKFNFMSVSGRFGRIFCLFFMARIQFPCKSTALTASFSVMQPPNAPFVLSCPPVDHICRVDAEDVKDFRPLRPGLDPPEIVVLFLCPERAFHRSCPHSGKFLSDKVFLLFLLTERTASFYERYLYPLLFFPCYS